MKTKLHVAAPEHEVAYQDIVALVRKPRAAPPLARIRGMAARGWLATALPAAPGGQGEGVHPDRGRGAVRRSAV